MTDPTFCSHLPDGFIVERVPGDPNNGMRGAGTRIEGWMPLVDEDYKHEGKVGEVYVKVEWMNDEDFDEGYKPGPRPDAMGQLSLNAEENNYRGNDPERECPLLRLSGDLPRLTL